MFGLWVRIIESGEAPWPFPLHIRGQPALPMPPALPYAHTAQRKKRNNDNACHHIGRGYRFDVLR